MNDIAELKHHVVVHARGQGIRDYRRILAEITSDKADAPGSWVSRWSQAGDELERRGRHLAACRRYAMAHFPYVDGPSRAEALARCQRALGRWADGQPDVVPLELALDGGSVRCWTTGLSTADRKPLLVVMGGIVTVKEQWAPLLANVRRLGMAGLVTELPGVGENTLRYTSTSHQMLTGLLDAVADRAEVSQTYAVALSFAGHLALRCALEDRRIRGIITVGAPISAFFTDVAWRRALPRLTVETLAHLTGTEPGAIMDGPGGWALTGEDLAALEIPLCYTASLRDEIIPSKDVELLRRHVRDLELVVHDDVHGSPQYVTATRLWTAASLLRVRDAHTPFRLTLALLARAARLRASSAAT